MDMLDYLGLHPCDIDHAESEIIETFKSVGLSDKEYDEMYDNIKYNLENYEDFSWDNPTNALISIMFQEAKHILEKECKGAKVNLYINGYDSYFKVEVRKFEVMLHDLTGDSLPVPLGTTETYEDALAIANKQSAPNGYQVVIDRYVNDTYDDTILRLYGHDRVNEKEYDTLRFFTDYYKVNFGCNYRFNPNSAVKCSDYDKFFLTDEKQPISFDHGLQVLAPMISETISHVEDCGISDRLAYHIRTMQDLLHKEGIYIYYHLNDDRTWSINNPTDYWTDTPRNEVAERLEEESEIEEER